MKLACRTAQIIKRIPALETKTPFRCDGVKSTDLAIKGGDIRLQDDINLRISDLRLKWLVHFGYVFCPDTLKTEMSMSLLGFKKIRKYYTDGGKRGTPRLVVESTCIGYK